MVKLTSNEGKVRKKLEKFPNGAKAIQLQKELFMSKTTLYETLGSLEIKDLAFRGEHSLWYPAEPSLQPVKKCADEHAKELKVIGHLSLVSVDDAWKRLNVFIQLLPKSLKTEVHRATFPIISDKEKYPDEYVALTIVLSKISDILLENQLSS